MKQAVIALITAVSLQMTLAWADQANDSTTGNNVTNLSGKWIVTPKTGNYGPSFAIGELILLQFGQSIEGMYIPSETHPSAMNCSVGPYKVHGRVEGNSVKLSAFGPGSTLIGQAAMESGLLIGDATEVFQNSRCSGTVSGKFTMKRI